MSILLAWWGIFFAILTDGIKVLYQNIRNLSWKPPPSFFSTDSVTAIITAKNEAIRIEKTIKSLVPHFRFIIVVDDGSTDGTADIARAVHPKIKVLQFHSKGKTAAQHAAIKEVATPYVMFFDADVCLAENFSWPDLAHGDFTASAFNVIPENEGSFIVELQKYEYAKSMMIIRKFESKSACVHCISGAAGVFKTQRVKELARFHSEIFQGEDLERSLIELIAHGKIIFQASEIKTQVPDTFFKLIKQRTFGWWPGLWRNLGYFAKLLFHEESPWRLRVEMFYELASLLTDPLKILSLTILIINGQWLFLLALYLLYIGFETTTFFFLKKDLTLKYQLPIILVSPLYSLLQIFLRLAALGVCIWKLLSKKWPIKKK